MKQKMNDGNYYSIEIPNLASKTKYVIVIPCQSRDFPLSNAIIATYHRPSLVSLLFIAWIPTSFLNL